MPYLNELDGSGSAPGMPAASQDQAAGLWPAGASLEEKRKNAHDKLVHDIFRKPENAGPLLQALLADRKSLPPLDYSRVTLFRLPLRNMASDTRKPDLLFQVPVVGSDEYVLVHLEHQSSFFELMPERMLGYFAAFCWTWPQKHPGEPRPRLIQILLCHDSQDHKRWAGPSKIVEGTGPVTSKGRWPGTHLFEFVIRDLEVISARRLRESPSLVRVPRAALALLKLAPAGRRRGAARLPEWVFDQLREEARVHPEESEDVLSLLRYAMITGRAPYQELSDLTDELGLKYREAFVTAVDTLLADRIAEIRSEGTAEARAEGRSEGRVEGRSEGRVEGRSEGRVEMLLRLIAEKWDKPSKRTEDTIKAGTDRQVRVWTAAILKEEKLADFLAAPDNPKYADR